MSEYQRYEFVALERPLTAKQMAELRTVSTRAEITPTRFFNEYNWGDFKGNAVKLVARYFDAHLYLANWGTRPLDGPAQERAGVDQEPAPLLRWRRSSSAKRR